DYGRAGRTGKAGDIGEARFAGRNRLTAMRIGARNEESFDMRLLHGSAQGSKARCDLSGVGFFLETLELCGRKLSLGLLASWPSGGTGMLSCHGWIESLGATPRRYEPYLMSATRRWER